jgi:hypothetical protein
MSVSNGKSLNLPESVTESQYLESEVKSTLTELEKIAAIGPNEMAEYDSANSPEIKLRKNKTEVKKVKFGAEKNQDDEMLSQSSLEEMNAQVTKMALSKNMMAVNVAFGEAMNLREVEEKCRSMVQ